MDKVHWLLLTFGILNCVLAWNLHRRMEAEEARGELRAEYFAGLIRGLSEELRKSRSED